ncbi:MAG: NAD(P)/FAD-dependent oxidoreductase [Flavobacteriales bacterium]
MEGASKVAVIGGGAAGFFAALSAAEHHPSAQVVLFEKTAKLLSKVKISGGGRCNVTHHCFSPSALSKHYPRGGKQLKKGFGTFQASDTVAWFESRGVSLKTEDDGRMFPTTDSSQTIIDCLVREAEHKGVDIRLQAAIQKLDPQPGGGFDLNAERFDKVIVATGGSPKREGLAWLEAIGHTVSDPVPSLFTFNMPAEDVTALMGVVVPDALVRIQGTKLSQQGPVLVTHWGMSGPAVLKLSAWGARDLAERGYEFSVQINWIGIPNATEAAAAMDATVDEMRKKKVANACPFELPKKFWAYLLERAEIPADAVWLDLGKKAKNKLLNTLLNDVYEVRGKTTFKEEFVTCGGITLGEVDFNTMQSRVIPGLYFAGEVLDVDGVTGGFNFQGAWTTGFVAGRLG